MKTSDELTELFRERGLRVTPQRQVIFRLLYGDDAHPTVESLYERAQAEMPTMSLKTVYQTVHDLEALGEVDVLDLGTGSRARRSQRRAHASSPRVPQLRPGSRSARSTFDGLRVPGRYRRDFTVDAVQVIFRGRCDDCS